MVAFILKTVAIIGLQHVTILLESWWHGDRIGENEGDGTANNKLADFVTTHNDHIKLMVNIIKMYHYMKIRL